MALKGYWSFFCRWFFCHF